MAEYKVLAAFVRDDENKKVRQGQTATLTGDREKRYVDLGYVEEVKDKAERSESSEGTDQEPERRAAKGSSKR